MVPLRSEHIIAAAVDYRETEARQVKAMRNGQPYRGQVRFSDYLARRQQDASYGFRQHIKEIAAAGEV